MSFTATDNVFSICYRLLPRHPGLRSAETKPSVGVIVALRESVQSRQITMVATQEVSQTILPVASDPLLISDRVSTVVPDQSIPGCGLWAWKYLESVSRKLGQVAGVNERGRKEVVLQKRVTIVRAEIQTVLTTR